MRRFVISLATALACAGLAGVAQGQSVDDLLGGAPPLPPEATDALNTAAEPAPYLRQQTSGTVEADTDYTPIAKESKLWNLHQGARYDSNGPETEEQYEGRFAGSQNSAGELVTTWDDELTDVAFSNTRNGFAGGQRKLDCKLADGSDGTDGVPDTYVPAIYRYGDSSTGLRWLKPTAQMGGLLEDCSNPGFVGQIVWLRTTGMALAVGGDGSYPYRAPAFGKDVDDNPCPHDPAKPYGANCDQAGLGRAWLYNHGRWQELDYDEQSFRNRSLNPSDPWGDTLHGMTALEFSPFPTRDFGFVGALGQVRPFTVAVKGQNGACEAADANECVSFPNEGELAVLGAGVVGKFDMDARDGPDGAPEMVAPPPDHPPEGGANPAKGLGAITDPEWVSWQAGAQKKPVSGDTDHAFRFRFRVRQVRMGIGQGASAGEVSAVAVTDGCCAGEPGSAAEGSGAQLGPAHNYPSVLLFGAYEDSGHPANHLAGGKGWRWQLWSADLYGQAYEHAAYYGLPEQQRRALSPPNTRQDWPDSFYSVTASAIDVSSNQSRISVIASPGGFSAEVPERPSLVSEPLCHQTDFLSVAASPGAGYQNVLLDMTNPGPLFTALRTQLASVRLVDGDGDELVAFAPPVEAAATTSAGLGTPPWAGAPSNAQRNTGFTCGQGTESRTRNADGSPPGGDAVPDWAVGELRSTVRPGLGARGLAFSTVSRPELVPGVLDLGWSGDEQGLAGLSAFLPPSPDPARVLATLSDPAGNPPVRQEKLVAYLQSQHFFTGSYALSALDYLDGFGTGWAVGQHGGIVQYGGSDQDLGSGAKVEPEPPPLGAKRPGTAPERAPYEPFDPPAVEPGAVPPLATRPIERLAEYVMHPAGSPNVAGDYANRLNQLGQLVISRDGSEGWGLDKGKGLMPATMTLFHYAHGAWSRCDPEGVDGVTAPDAACSDLAPLRARTVGGKTESAKVGVAARIAYENDADASNDDEFEVFAIGTDYPCQPTCLNPSDGSEIFRPVLMRYREGAWKVENDRAVREFLGINGGSTLTQMAFVAPDDGWALAPGNLSGPPKLLHFNGESWITCLTSLNGDPRATSDVRFSDRPEISDNPTERKRWCDDENQLTIAATTATETPDAGINPSNIQDIDNFTGLTVAGRRLYLYGYRTVGGQDPVRYPLVLCKDAGTDWRSVGCGLDPGLAVRFPEPGEEPASESLTGQVNALSVAVDEQGNHRGWAAGAFGGPTRPSAQVRETDFLTFAVESAGAESAPPIETALLRLDDSPWHPYTDEGLLRDAYASDARVRGLNADTKVVALPDGGGLISGNGTARFEADIGRWRAFPGSQSVSRAAVPDGLGGAWLADGAQVGGVGFTRYTNRPPKPVLGEVASPLPRKDESFTGLAGQPDGSLWASTSDGALYRYTRTTGWDRVPIPGWRAKRATVTYAAYALAVNDSGVGVVVGREGRIADLAGSEVRLNPAAGTLCDLTEVAPPCGTSRHLRAAAVSPQGAAIVGGEQLSLLWRPSGGEFRAVEKPEAASSAEVTGLSLPAAGVAYLTTNTGQLFRGELRGECPHPEGAELWWCWRPEGTDANGNLLTLDPTGARAPAALRAVAVDASGHGYAAGARGVLLERSEGVWRMLRSGVSYDLTSVTLAGESALVGGAAGLVLTGREGQFAVARPGDPDGEQTGNVVGLALLGGTKDGQAEAWAVTDGPGGAREGDSSGLRALISNISQLFHYASQESEPLLNPQIPRAGSFADSPALRAGEVSFAALGKLDCHREHAICPLFAPGSEYLTLSRRSVEEIAARGRQPGGPSLAVFTGDLADDGGIVATGTVESASPPQQVRFQLGPANLVGAAKLRTSRRWLAEPLARGGLSFFSAVGSQDLASSQVCHGAGNPGLNPSDSCQPTQELARPGVNDAWRAAFAPEPAPWGRGKRFSDDRYEVRPLSRLGSELRVEDPGLEAGGAKPKLPLGGARTHYAFDLVEKETGRKLTRFAFADNSLKSLQASDPLQYPLELEANESGSGQAGWLKRVLCTTGSGCSREPNQPAIVVANASTYSNASGDPRFWAKDAAVFEKLLMDNRTTTVVSGSLGWSGRYWATAPGLHEPCQGESYRDSAPKPGTSSCRGHSTEELPLGASGIAPVANQLGSALGPARPALDQAQSELNVVTGQGLLPFVVASGAGGKLSGQGAGEGFFHGYTIVRVPGDANPAGVLVEQRPIFDFLSITAASHVLRPGQKMALKGIGRGALASDSSGSGERVASFEPIDAAAIGHRYDLVEADPQKPWLPRRQGSAYVPLDPSVATVDPETGVIAVGKGNNPRTFALGMLSVGCSGTQAGADGACDPSDPGVHVATFPLLFESRRTFKQPIPPPPPVAQVRAQAQATLPQPPNPPPPPNVQNAPLPSPPNVPVPPAPQVPEVNAPVPPIPPPPPIQQHPVPLDLSASAPSVTIAPQTTVIPPPAPPIQPAPPGGARREARQRQSATQSSGSGSGSENMSDATGDTAPGPQQPHGAAMTRYDRARADGGSMTAYYGASVTLLAIVAAFGWNYGRPGPRRRSPVEAAPARAWNRRRW